MLLRQPKTDISSIKWDILIIFCLMIVIYLFITKTSYAQQITQPTPFPLLTQSALFKDETASSSVLLDSPLIEIENTFSETPEATPPGIPLAEDDYCINMPVIMYHHVQPLALAEKLGHTSLTIDSTMFDEHMKYLTDHNYTAISLDDLINALYTRSSLPENPVMITLDDGYDDNYTYAFMTAKKYHMMMNFMIPTGLVGTPGYVTWDHLREMRDNPYARIYNHTTTHAGLGVISKEEIIKEVTAANTDLSNQLGLQNDIVIYPYGSYSDMAIETLKELHMRAAVSTDAGRDECLSNIMKLPRIRVGNASLDTYGL